MDPENEHWPHLWPHDPVVRFTRWDAALLAVIAVCCLLMLFW